MRSTAHPLRPALLVSAFPTPPIKRHSDGKNRCPLFNLDVIGPSDSCSVKKKDIARFGGKFALALHMNFPDHF